MPTVKQKAALKRFSAAGRLDFNKLYVYVVRCNNYFKIGVAYNLDQRLNSLQNGNPYELELVAATQMDKEVAKAIELKLHEALADRKIMREWFELETQELVETIIGILVEVGGNAL